MAWPIDKKAVGIPWNSFKTAIPMAWKEDAPSPLQETLHHIQKLITCYASRTHSQLTRTSPTLNFFFFFWERICVNQISKQAREKKKKQSLWFLSGSNHVQRQKFHGLCYHRGSRHCSQREMWPSNNSITPLFFQRFDYINYHIFLSLSPIFSLNEEVVENQWCKW